MLTLLPVVLPSFARGRRRYDHMIAKKADWRIINMVKAGSSSVTIAPIIHWGWEWNSLWFIEAIKFNLDPKTTGSRVLKSHRLFYVEDIMSDCHEDATSAVLGVSFICDEIKSADKNRPRLCFCQVYAVILVVCGSPRSNKSSLKSACVPFNNIILSPVFQILCILWFFNYYHSCQKIVKSSLCLVHECRWWQKAANIHFYHGSL